MRPDDCRATEGGACNTTLACDLVGLSPSVM
jgi:hypothetical protein